MNGQLHGVSKPLDSLKKGLLETVYPTRCAVCDKPGTLLCPSCEQALSYIDYWRACPRCGGAWGYSQCTECNSIALKPYGLLEPSFDSCRNAVNYDESTKRIVAAYKDQGERRIAHVMARIASRSVSPELTARITLVTFVPATAKALRRRDFDHAELLARLIADTFGLPCQALLRRPHTLDQRALHRGERRLNMQGAFVALRPNIAKGQRLLLVDDVMTTGSTLLDASAALKSAGALEVHALTFAHAL